MKKTLYSVSTKDEAIFYNKKLYNGEFGLNYDKTHDLETPNYIQEIFLNNINYILKDLINNTDGLNLLDIGTGTGALALNYYKFIRPYDKVYCLDVSELMINNLKQKLSIEQISQSRFIVDDALNFLINTDLTFDVIGFASSLHHMFDYEYVIEKACIKIKKDGYLYIALEPKSQGSILETTYRKYENIIKRYKMNEFSFLRLVIKALYIPFHFLNKFSIPTNIAIENEANIKSEVVISGLNLNRILEILHSNNMEICKLNNGASYIYKLSFKLMNLLGLNTHFELIAKKRK